MTKRRLSDAEVQDLDFKECKVNVLLRISSVYVNAGTFSPVATPEAIVVKREDIFPDVLDDCDQMAGLEMGWSKKMPPVIDFVPGAALYAAATRTW